MITHMIDSKLFRQIPIWGLTIGMIRTTLTYMNPTETLIPRTDKRNAAFAPYFRAIKVQRAEGVTPDEEAFLTLRHAVLSSRYRQNVPPVVEVTPELEMAFARIAAIILDT